MPTSRGIEHLHDHYRDVAAAVGGGLTLEDQRTLVEHWGDSTVEPGGVDYIEVDAGGVPAMWAIPKGSPDDRALLALHGGGFIAGSIATHRKLFAHIGKAAGVRVLIAGFRRTPEFQHPAQVDDATDAYAWLLARGFRADRVAFVGDSAGGGLTVTAALRARHRGLPLPAALMPISAWFDFELGGTTRTSNRWTDLIFGGEHPMSIETLVQLFLGPNGDRKDPFVNPLYADLAGLPPIYLQAGGAEMILDDTTRLAERARAAGVEVRVDIFPDQQHTFHMAAGRSPVSDDAIRKLGAWVRPKLGL